MKSFEFTGKNLEKAIENGLKELGKNREDVNIKVLSEGGLFSKAKVLISFEEESAEKLADEIVKEEIDDIEIETCDCGCKKHECGDENADGICDCGCPECECEKEEKEEPVCSHCGDKTSEENIVKENEEKVESKKQFMTSEEVFEEINNIFSNIFKALNINGKVMVLENDDAYEVKVSGDENVSMLIGHRGEALNAYQILLNSFLSLKNKSKKILLDCENYRSKREESLKALAVRIAKKVVKTKRSHKFEPMSSFERHVIHEELSNFEGVSTHSEGVEPRRCLIVDYVKKD